MLGIFGDSYAYRRDNTAWCSLLETNFHIHHHALYGTSIWNAFKKFKKNYKKYKHIIFSYSVPNRIHHISNEFEKFMYIKNPNHPAFESIKDLSKSDIDILKLVTTAMKYIDDNELDMFIYQQVFNEVNAICKDNSITLINLMPFENSLDWYEPIDLSKATGPCITGVHWISQNEKDNPSSTITDERACHLSSKNNRILYRLILNIFKGERSGIINVKEENIFAL